jgi:hypothetical protein
LLLAREGTKKMVKFKIEILSLTDGSVVGEVEGTQTVALCEGDYDPDSTEDDTDQPGLEWTNEDGTVEFLCWGCLLNPGTAMRVTTATEV